MKELAFVALFVVFVLTAYAVGTAVARLKHGRWRAAERTERGRLMVYVEKGPNSWNDRVTIGSVHEGDEDFDQQLYNLRAAARERAMTLNAGRG